MKRLQILITLLLTVGFAIGQTVYPIRTFTVVNAPAPYALSGFASEPGRVQLNILTDDIALDRYAVKFRLTIQGNGLKLFTKPDFHQQPFYLDGGVTQTLTGMDLEALFNPDNLVFEGYSASEYRRNGRLPEGVYRVWVDLLDYYRGMQVSQSLPGMAMIYLTRAPRLSFPLPGTEIDPLVEPNIRFAWMGSLPADPLADVVYQFRLWETRPVGRDPYEVVAVSSPLFTQEVENPNFIYDMGMPPLTDGMTYVWQVRALDREGRALFQNSGLSNASTFRYGRSCPVPDVAITSVAHTSASVKWQGSQAAQLYRISYRPTRDSNWQHAETTSSSYTFNNLADNTPYEVMVQAVCNGQEGDPGRVVGFKTTRQVDYTCGGKGGQFDLSNREPLPSLSRFDEFKAADFIVEVDEVMGQDGRFSGNGFALVPYLGFAKFMVTFNNIFVNADRRMTEGHIQFVVNDTTGLVLGLGTDKGNGNNGTGTTELDPGTIADEVYTVDGDVTNITVTGNTVTVTNGDGTTQTIVVKDGNTVAVVPSSGGTVYVADQATGSVYTTPKTQAGGGKPGSVGTSSQTGQYNCGIDFKAPKQMRFGHDPVGNGKTKPDAYFRTNASGSRVGWKSLRAGDTDIIDLVPRGGCQADSLRYLRASGLATPTAPQGKGHRLLLGGLAAGDEDMLTVAVAKTQHINDTTKREILTEAGALGLVAYDQIRKRVILVKVNDSRMPDVVTAIRDSLNAHYKPAVVEWTVDVNGSAVTVPSITPEGFKTAGSGLFARYTSDMRKVINAFEQQHGAIGKDDLCLFFVDVADQSRDGFMPLDGQYGFIFNFNNDPATVAHELAHGAFNLRHTFSSKAQHYLPEKTTHNLLDYANGTELWKYQWDLIHNPETILLGFMQDESEGAKILIEKSDKFVGILERIRCAYKTNQTFDYDKPLGFVNGVLRHEGITLGDGHTYQEISLVMKDDVIACDPRNVSIDKKTNFYNFLFRGFSINVVGATDGQQLEKYLFDTSEAEYNTQQAKAIVKLHNELSKPTPDVDAATSLLYGLSDCTLQQLTSTIREKSLALLLDGAGAYLPKWNERIIISLIRSALYDKGKAKSLYDCLCQKPALLYGLYDRTSFLRGEFIEALTLLCAQNWTQEQLDGLSADRYYITGSKELTLRSRFNDSKALDIWQLWANDNFKKSNSCNGIPPLSPVGLGDDCSSCSAGDIAYMPAIYVQSLTDAADVQSIKALANAALTFAGATGSVNLLLNSSRLVKILGVIELANLTADGVLANPLVRARLAQTENGKSFLQVWPYVNMGIDLATVSTDILVNFVNSGRKAAAVLDELPANNVANRLDEAEDVLRKRGVATAGAEIVGSYDWGLVKRYFQHIQEVTGRPVPQVQIDKLKEALRAKEYSKLIATEYVHHTKQFTTAKRNELIARWEFETGQKWPTYTERVYTKNGEIYKEVGDNYDAHHIIEQNFGGEHEWWNMHPAKFPNEHQGGIHGAGSPARELFK